MVTFAIAAFLLTVKSPNLTAAPAITKPAHLILAYSLAEQKCNCFCSFQSKHRATSSDGLGNTAMLSFWEVHRWTRKQEVLPGIKCKVLMKTSLVKIKTTNSFFWESNFLDAKLQHSQSTDYSSFSYNCCTKQSDAYQHPASCLLQNSCKEFLVLPFLMWHSSNQRKTGFHIS